PRTSLKDDAEATQPGGPLVILITPEVAQAVLGAPAESLAVGAAGSEFEGSVGFSVGPSEAPARNVVAIVRGTDPALREQYVAIGAHNDHVGMASEPVEHDSLRAYLAVIQPEGAEDEPREPSAEEAQQIRAILDSLRAIRAPRMDSIYNGADDDASGTVTVLEIAEAFAADPPKRSVLFVWHTGEEKGLWGSQYYTDHPTVPRDSIVAQINMDMVGRGNAWDVTGGGPAYMQLIGSRRLSTELGDIVEEVNTDGNFGFTFDYTYDADGHPANYYCRSDHYMYARYGIPIVFFTTGSHRDYHQLTDEAQYINYNKMTRVGTLVHAIAEHVANMDHRPVVD
ncbi:MAG: M28 family metallopeptidase, partial [Gemmatimonadales bacterium]